MFGCDLSWMSDAFERMNESTLGAVVLAGSCFSIDRVFDRSFISKLLNAGVHCAIHLSRLAEKIILWLSEQFCFIRLSDIFSPCSSMMPKKSKLVAAKLVRAKTG